ncbi:hypothetical protein [Methylobacterium sp. J-090]|uniref:hypothetical protein n=1 Tax=Methylobacterium sp. J-090 TaxID=2836666 RepID=UPI001FBBF63C|nr:hypothetical protein [Methylobacterium sp. J-090]MCJ2080161.1 hypothetical protein [Methylobacterium sp. J-090]
MTFLPHADQVVSETAVTLGLSLHAAPEVAPASVHVAIMRHRAAFDAYQSAPEGAAAMVANDDYDAATEALVSTACGSHAGALALLSHLRCWLAEEAEFSAGHQPGYRLAETRVADLALLLNGGMRPAGCAPSARRAAIRPRNRLPQIGEALAALLVVAGGMLAVGIATLV